jgi:hypothetical protein
MSSRRTSNSCARAARLGALVLGLLAAGSLVWPRLGSAQVAMHREVPRGEVTGLEMGIEGSLVATPGAPVRWWITLYEVVRRRELRPAPGCSVRAMASHDRAEPIAAITTDASGRAALVMPMTDALAESPHLVLDATCPRGVRRLFDVDLELDSREQLVLAFDRGSVVPGGSALAIGRVLDRATGRGLAGVDVDLQVQQGGPVGAPRRVRTDGAGMFATRVVAGEAGQRLAVTAWTVHEDGSSSSSVQSLVVAPPSAPEALSVRVTTTPAIAAPGALVDVVVEVRDADGAPVEGALVSGPERDPAPEGSTEPLPEIRTDARGLAHHPWRLDRDLEAGALVETTTSVNVTSTALGSRSAGASVRVARRRTFVTLALEGGALVPGAPTRVLARALGPDGTPLAGRTLTLTSAMLGSVDGAPLASAQTDAEGMAVFVVPRVGDAVVDDCGGTTATAVELVMDGETTSTCVPVDPDAPFAIQASPRLAPGSALPVAILRTGRSSTRPVVVTALRRGLRGWQPIAQEIAPAGATSVTLTPGDLATGEIWVRARMVMPDGQVVRGASTLVSFSPAPGSLSIEADRQGARVQGADATDSVFVLAERASPGTGGDETDLVSLLTGEVGRDDTTASLSGLALEAELAIRVPLDLGASSILRGGVVVPQAMPEEPVTLGLLRDPWRTRARFVRGRLGRLFLAVEDMVERRIPDRIGEVASVGPRGWSWNREMLAPAVAEAAIDDEGSASLDGEPLDIDALVALDPSFTFDHVARRLTRKRLFRVIRAIRRVTHERNLDLAWARRGDPRTWIASLVGVSLGDGSELETNDLFDAWGHAFVFRPTTRRAFLPAIEGWEVASLGPDGRDGTGDDLFDPFARVVPSGTLYADAVGEDALVARLTGVALGRSWITVLDEELVSDDRLIYLDDHPSLGLLADAWGAAPMPMREVPPLGRRVPIAQQPGAHLGEGRALRWTLPAERRSYAAIAIAVPREGRPRLASRTFEAGATIVLRATLPDVLRVGDRISVPIAASELDGGAAPRLALVPTGAAARATLSSVVSSETGTTSGRVVLEASTPGAIDLELTATPAEGEPMTVRRRVRVLPAGALVATHTSALLAPGQTLSLLRGEGDPGRVLGTTLSVATPRGLDRAPFFVALETGPDEQAAAVLAWARSLEGELDPALASRAVRGSGSEALADACALVALSSTEDHVSAIGTLRSGLAGRAIADLRERAAILVALSGIASPGVEPSSDPIAALVAGLRADGWRALATERSSPAVMARVAAGLLLANPEDGPGRALYRSALEATVRNDHDERVVPGDPTRVGDGWIGTLALALAARQIGEDLVADELARASSRELHLLRRTGREGPFWALAASVFGAFGAGERALDEGARQALSLEAGSAVIAPDARVVAPPGSPLLVAIESRAVREVTERREAGFDARVEGVLGDAERLGEAGARSALELVIESGPEAIAAPVVEIDLPALARFDEVSRAALARAQAIDAVDGPDRGGVLRLRLRPLAASTTVRVPLVLSWLGAGRARGLSTIAYDAASPTRTSTRAGRTIQLGTGDEAGGSTATASEEGAR